MEENLQLTSKLKYLTFSNLMTYIIRASFIVVALNFMINKF